MRTHFRLLTLLSVLFSLSAQVQAQPADLFTKEWPARWISVPETGALDYGVYYFRKDVNLATVPATYVVHVTGDNRYKLYEMSIWCPWARPREMPCTETMRPWTWHRT